MALFGPNQRFMGFAQVSPWAGNSHSKILTCMILINYTFTLGVFAILNVDSFTYIFCQLYKI
jgi:hypothetical protein